MASDEDWDDWSDLGAESVPDLDDEDRILLVSSIERHSLARQLEDKIRAVHPSRTSIILQFLLHAFGTELLRELCRGDAANLDNMMEHTLGCLDAELNAALNHRKVSVKGKERVGGVPRAVYQPESDGAARSQSDVAGACGLMDLDARARRVRILSRVRQWCEPNTGILAATTQEEQEEQVLMQVIAAENLGAVVNPFGDTDRPTSNDHAVALALQADEYDSHINPRPADQPVVSFNSGPVRVGAGGSAPASSTDFTRTEAYARRVSATTPAVSRRQRRILRSLGLTTTADLGPLFTRNVIAIVEHDAALCVRCTIRPTLNSQNTLCQHFCCRDCCAAPACQRRRLHRRCFHCFRRHEGMRLCRQTLMMYAQRVLQPRLERQRQELEEEQQRIAAEAEMFMPEAEPLPTPSAREVGSVGFRLPRDEDGNGAMDLPDVYEVASSHTTCFTWGKGTDGQIGHGPSVPSSSEPRQLSRFTSHGLAKVVCGRNNTFVVDAKGQLHCWGTSLPRVGQAYTPRLHPFSAQVQVVDVAILHSCGIGAVLTAAGTVYVWFTTRNSATSTQGGGLIFLSGLEATPISAISAGYSYLLLLAENGSVFTFGYDPADLEPQHNGANTAGAAATSTENLAMPRVDAKTQYTTAIRVPDLTNVVSIVAGDTHCAALDRTGQVHTWGASRCGALGLGKSVTVVAKPKVIPDLSGIAVLAGGARHMVAIDQSGTAFTWGSNQFGQLGNGTVETAYMPKRLNLMYPMRGAACGINHTAFVSHDGDLLMCGDNRAGQLGLGHETEQLSPTVVKELLQYDVQSVSLGGSHTSVVAIARSPTARGLGCYVGSNVLSDIFLYTTADEQVTPAHKIILARLLPRHMLAPSVTALDVHGCRQTDLLNLLASLYTENADAGNDNGATDMDIPDIIFTKHAERTSGEESFVVAAETLRTAPELSQVTLELAATLKPSIHASEFKLQSIDLPAFSDIVFQVGNNSIGAHRLVLASRAEVFRVMFTTGLRESERYNDLDIPEVRIPGVSRESFIAFLAFFYTGAVNPTDATVTDLITLSHQYQILPVMSICEGYLSNAVAVDNVIDLALVSDVYSLKALHRKCTAFASAHGESILTHYRDDLDADAPEWLARQVYEASRTDTRHRDDGSCSAVTKMYRLDEEDDYLCYENDSDDDNTPLIAAMKHLGGLVKSARTQKAMSVDDLAHRCHVPAVTVRKIEDGKFYAHARLRVKLGRALQCRFPT